MRRYVDRIDGNLSLEAAGERLERLAAKARPVRELPGKAWEYRLQRLSLIVSDGVILTVYRGAR